jgi:hypothetical protein
VAASLSKTSSNWSARAISVMSKSHSTGTDIHAEAPATPPKQSRESLSAINPARVDLFTRRGSAPALRPYDDYSPPPRPTHFRSPRDSRIDMAFTPPERSSDVAESSDAAASASELTQKLSALTPTGLLKRVSSTSGMRSGSASPRPPRSAPRPLVLNASALITATNDTHTIRSATSTPTPHQGQWSDVLRTKVQHRQNASRSSSISSSTTSPGIKDRSREWDSDASPSSRIVRLNRSSVSPMATAFLSRQRKQSSSSLREQAQLRRRSPPNSDAGSQAASTETGDESSHFSRSRGWEMVSVPDSPSTLASPPPKTPTNFAQVSVKVSTSEGHRDSLTFREPEQFEPPAEQLIQPKMIRKPTFPPRLTNETDETSDSSVAPTSPRSLPRLRSKRYGTKPPSLRTQETNSPSMKTPTETESPFSNLLALATPDNEYDAAPTPRAADFPRSPTNERLPPRLRKSSTESKDPRPRKISQDTASAKARKAVMDAHHRRSESAADEGDDEGYDELLSAYESEEGFR